MKTPVEPTETPWLLTVPEVAQITRTNAQTIRIAIREGKLPAGRPGPRHYLVTRQAVADWAGISLEDVRSRCSDPTPDADDRQDAA